MIPYNKNKFSSPAIFTPEKYLEYARANGRIPVDRPPETVIFVYTKKLADRAKNHFHMSNYDGIFHSLLKSSHPGKSFGVLGRFGIGAPATIVMLEELIAWGVKRFISVGFAGSLQKDLVPGDVVLCTEAICDEGSSHHYLENIDKTYPSKYLADEIAKALEDRQITYKRGGNWTIDTPYRETEAEVLALQKAGVLTVDMETSALFAVAKYRKVDIAQVFVVSDSLADLVWNPQFFNLVVGKSIEDVFDAVLDFSDKLRF